MHAAEVVAEAALISSHILVFLGFVIVAKQVKIPDIGVNLIGGNSGRTQKEEVQNWRKWK